MGLAAPWLTRALLLAEKGLVVRLVDLRGVLADASVALVILGVVGALVQRGRWWGRALGALVLGAFLFATFGIYEVVSELDSLYALNHAGFLADATFVKGSVLHMRRPLLLALLALAGAVGVLRAVPPGRSWWTGWSIALGLCVFGQAMMPMSLRYDGWRQRHAVHAQASLLPASSKLGASAGVGAEVRKAFTADLGGERWVGPLSARPNVLLIMVEGASAPLLPSIATTAKVLASASMPKLDAIAAGHILFTRVVSHQRQTNRGEYAILCGDYPKLLTDQSKMTEQVYGQGRRCLPTVLRDAGYATVYIQAAPLGFMLKDQFMKKAGFEELIGDEWFEKSYARTEWGVDDQAFFEQALVRVVELHDEPRPFFATMLTVGTHHPFTIPEQDEVDEGEGRRKRAFRYADDALEQFLRALETRGVLEDTVVVISSDESGGMVETEAASVRLLAQSWSFAVVMLPEPLAKRVDTLNQQADAAVSITDLLDIDDQAAAFLGRSWFRAYPTPRRLFSGNTYARRLIMWTPTEETIVCDEWFDDCKSYATSDAGLLPSTRGRDLLPRERRILAEVARMTRSGGSSLQHAPPLRLLASERVVLSVGEGKKLLVGGQYLTVPAGASVFVSFDVEVEGKAAEVELHQDLFLDGRERFARKAKRLRAGDRWRLRYAIRVPTDAGKLVAQLYATALSGEQVALRFRAADLAMIEGSAPSWGVELLQDEVSNAKR